MDLYFALYRSTASHRLRSRAQLDIILQSLRNNERDNITGFLHNEAGCFLQYIEGPRAAVMRKLAIIQRDPRHHSFVILADGHLDERLFAGWDMGQLEDIVHLSDETLMEYKAWLTCDAPIDPVPLLSRFVQAALGQGAADIETM